jgi:hypothetical protein
MRNPKTLFIIGAGASREANLPTGKELTEIISRRLDYRVANGSRIQGHGDDDILDIFQQRTQTREGIDAYLQAAWRIRDGIVYSKSIDSFIDLHRDDERIQLCGKLAIVKSILEAEKNSYLYIDSQTEQFDVANLKESWFFEFAKNLNDGVRKPEIAKMFEKVSFVIFNYDRCFEHFMFHAIQQLYGVPDAEAADVMSQCRIVHPYGTIGELPWQDKEGIPFGFKANRANLEFMAQRIRTYTEQVQRSETLSALKTVVAEADTLVFLGFSYHPENMKLLSLENPGKTERVLGTAKGISPSDVEKIQQQIRRMAAGKALQLPGQDAFSEQLFIKDLTCSELLQHYSRTLFTPDR